MPEFIDPTAHTKQLEKIIADHQRELLIGGSLWLRLRVVAGSKNPDGTWNYEYYVHTDDPWEEEDSWVEDEDPGDLTEALAQAEKTLRGE